MEIYQVDNESVIADLLLELPSGFNTCLEATTKKLRSMSDLIRFVNVQSENLNTNFPQVEYLDTYVESCHLTTTEATEMIGWVDPSKIVQTLPYTDWGNFVGGHPEVPISFMNELAYTFTDMERLIWAYEFSKNPIRLTAIDGPLGPIYMTRGDGVHRVFTARALELPWVIARVRTSTMPSSRISYVEVYQSEHVVETTESAFDKMVAVFDINSPVPMPTIQGLRIAMGHIGVADVSFSEDEYTMTTSSASPWLLFPESARLTEAAYQRAYPKYKSPIPADALEDQNAFNSWVANIIATIEID